MGRRVGPDHERGLTDTFPKAQDTPVRGCFRTTANCRPCTATSSPSSAASTRPARSSSARRRWGATGASAHCSLNVTERTRPAITRKQYGIPGTEVKLDPADEQNSGLSKICYASCKDILTREQAMVEPVIGLLSDAVMQQIAACLKVVMELYCTRSRLPHKPDAGCHAHGFAWAWERQGD